MILQIRTSTSLGRLLPLTACPREVVVDPEQQTGGLPWLHGEFAIAVPRRLVLQLRIYNRPGIPIITGESRIDAGQRHFTFSDMHPLGVEAYAHAPEAQRVQMAQRVWSRRAYGALAILSP